MIRVLQCVNDMHRAGLETILMNYYRHIDREAVQFDFLTHRPWKSDYDEEIVSLGGRIYYAPRLYPQNYPAYFRYMKRFYADHPEYRIVHSHIDSMSYLPLLAAKKAGVPVRIAHSHNTSLDPDFKYLMKEYFRLRLPGVATDYLACGTEAGRYMFGDREFKVIPNAIDTSRFRFDEGTRCRIRDELGITDRYVIGCVGRLTRQKNIAFMIEVFRELCERLPDVLLLVVGGGEEEESLKRLARQTGFGDRIRFLGVRSDVSDLYQAMDLFVMPSLYEGLPVVGVEAQFAGLPCLFSTRITGEIRLSGNAHFLSIDRPASDWADYILRVRSRRGDRSVVPSDSQYDIRNAGHILEQYYIQLENMHL